MVKVKPIDIVAKKWTSRASVATDDYRYGVQNPKEDWQRATENAFDRYVKGVQEAIADKRFVGGVRSAGTEKWQKKALEVGADRYATGVRAAVEEYAQRMQEVLSVIEGIKLPERGPRGDPKNIERVAAIAKTLHEWKKAKKKVM